MREINRNSVGMLRSGANFNSLRRATIEFIYRSLQEWRDDLTRDHEEIEERLNIQLSKFLNASARQSFPMVQFNREEFQFKNRRVDMSVTPIEPQRIESTTFSIYEPFMVAECKRLPAPSNDREFEYITGCDKLTGGIQRFKHGLHGSKHEESVMIGYIQKDSVCKWHGLINEWIDALAEHRILDSSCKWMPSEKLQVDAFGTQTARCRSLHPRKNSITENITIHHLWIVMH